MAGETRLYVLEEKGVRCLDRGLDAAALAQLHGSLAGAVYSGARTFAGRRFLNLTAHIDRCERSAQALGFSIEELRAPLCAALDAIASERAPDDTRFQFHLAPAPVELFGVRSRVWISAQPLQPVPAEFLERGVGVELAPALRREQPLVKATRWMSARSPLPLGSRERYEHLMLDADGGLLEGTSSNVFVVAGGRLLTAGDGVLEGITRGLVLRLAAERGLEVELRAPRIDELTGWDEAFLSSSSRGIVPIVTIDGRPVGAGTPGPITNALRRALDELAEREARPAV